MASPVLTKPSAAVTPTSPPPTALKGAAAAVQISSSSSSSSRLLVSVHAVADAKWAAGKAVAAGQRCRQQAQARGVLAVRSASGALPSKAAIFYPKVSVLCLGLHWRGSCAGSGGIKSARRGAFPTNFQLLLVLPQGFKLTSIRCCALDAP